MKAMLITYIQVVTQRKINKKHHFQDEKYKEKIERPIKSCEVFIPAYRQAGLTGWSKRHKN